MRLLSFDTGLRLFVVLCVSISFASFFVWSLNLYYILYFIYTLGFMDSLVGTGGYTSSAFASLLTPFVYLCIFLVAVSLFLSFRTDLGPRKGGWIPPAIVFDEPRELFKAIGSGMFSLKYVFILAAAISFTSSLFGFLDSYVFTQAKLGALTSALAGNSIASIPTTSYVASGLLPTFGGVLLIAFASILRFAFFFALAFFLYWGLRLLGEKATYSSLLAAVVYLSLIPLAFTVAAALVDIASYYLAGNVSSLNSVLFPYIGLFLFYGVLAYGFREAGVLSSRKALFLILPFIAILLVLVLVDYLNAFVVIQRLLELVIQQLGL